MTGVIWKQDRMSPSILVVAADEGNETVVVLVRLFIVVTLRQRQYIAALAP